MQTGLDYLKEKLEKAKESEDISDIVKADNMLKEYQEEQEKQQIKRDELNKALNTKPKIIERLESQLEEATDLTTRMKIENEINLLSK